MNFSLILAAFVAIAQFTLGLRVNRFTPDFGSLFAYRTDLARKNEDTWYEANLFAGKVLMRSASLILLFLVVMESYHLGRDWELLVVFVYSLLSFLFVYIRTEKYLQGVFFKDGKRRPKF
ncbi:MAG: SdpI family protein [Bacteroidota bacterium]